jgi:UDP-N-acetylglucosamine:LPS N-acetylglucosamine transferase
LAKSKVELLYFNAGGGHRSAAQALERVLSRQHDVVLTNLFDVIDVEHLFKKITGQDHEDLYNRVLAAGFTWGLGPQLKLLQLVIKAQRRSLVKKLKKHWGISQPDFVVSLIPNFNRSIGESIDGPFLTVITDLADNPPNFWIEPKLKNQHVVCGTDYAVQQAIDAGVDGARVHQVDGMILRPSFYDAVIQPRNADPVGLVMFGGIGSKEMVPIAKLLSDRKLILICGKSEKLRLKLRELENPKHTVIGFTQEIPFLMGQSDYFIGKPGPGSISEAMFMGLPVIVPLNSRTMPQERWNATFVHDAGVGLVVKNFKHVDGAVSTLLSKLGGYRANIKTKNNAVYQVSNLITQCAKRAGH